MDAFPIAGLKQSGPLALVRAPGATGPWLRSLLSSLAEKRLNLALLAWQPGPEPAKGGLCFCVDHLWGASALALARQNAEAHGLPEPSLLGPAAALTVYPLSKNLKLPALMLAAFSRSALQPLGMATSLSAVVALVAKEHLGPALETLQSSFALPPGVSPPTAGIKVLQMDSAIPGAALAEPVSGETVAVYNERPVSCYGLKAEEGLELWLANSPARAWSAAAVSLADREPSPRLGFLAAYWQNDSCSLCICLPAGQSPPFIESPALFQGGPRPACLIHLQGPHFGDRPGIAAEALIGLAAGGVEPLALSGVVHSLFLAVEPAGVPAALDGLTTRFNGPKR
jgi:hypothetical protein